MKSWQSLWNDIRSGQNLDIYLTLLVSLTVMILGVVGIVDQGIISSAILACLAVVAGSLLNNRRAFSNTETSIIQALQGVKVTKFGSRQDDVHYRADKLRKAKKIDDVTWRLHGHLEQTFSGEDINAFRKQWEVTSEVARKQGVVWREVVTFRSLEQFNQEKLLLLDSENVGYNLAFYEASSNSPPRIGFMIIDDTELFIAYSPKDFRLVIQHPDVVAVFSAYFEDIWRSATKLKKGNQVDKARLEQIEKELRELESKE